MRVEGKGNFPTIGRYVQNRGLRYFALGQVISITLIEVLIMEKYKFDNEGYFVIQDYDNAKTFSSFLPGVAGLYGVPMWAFYVNRGQAMVSFGVQDKNHAITEFFPANQAYQRVSMNGFRTFIKVKGEAGESIIEPFSSYGGSNGKGRSMKIKENELKIEEIDEVSGIKTVVTYFTLPNENFGALIRKVEIENISDKAVQMEVLDGLPAIIPFGIDDAAYKAVGNTLKSWMDVFNLENNIPYYRVRSSTNDTAEVEEITKGHFYLSFVNDGELLSPIVDGDLIFGHNSSMSYPNMFEQYTVSQLVDKTPITSNKVPCGFSAFEASLQPDENVVLNTIIGHVNDIEIVNNKKDEIVTSKFINLKYEEAKTIVNDITEDVTTKTAHPLFDAYSKQSYLDNILRGGYPITLGTDQNPFVYYVYSRKHGDLERDYNFFSLAPEFFSQGNGNFRDVNQNRRNDVFFHPEVGDYNIKLFMSLVQADGYNPLVVKGASFELVDKTDMEWLSELFTSLEDSQFMKQKLNKTFTPGDVLQTIVDKQLSLSTSLEDFLTVILSKSKQNIEAEFGEGYWMDHWTYNLDLIENYLKIFPENKASLLFKDQSYKYFYSPVFVKPRSEKYVLANDKVRQYGAILEEEQATSGNWLTTKSGEEYTTNLFVKLFNLSLVKFATLDPYGMGVEMEANKPGWNDSMNGLPGLFGSGMSETFELKRLLQFVKVAAATSEESSISLPVEVHKLFESVNKAINESITNSVDDYHYWNAVTSAREQYREAIRSGFSGEESAVSLATIEEMVTIYLTKIHKGITKAKELGNGLVPTYFYFEAEQYVERTTADGSLILNDKGQQLVEVTSFTVHTLPHFLEGPARALKSMTKQEASDTYTKVKASDMFDRDLKMYKTSSSLEDETFEIGRSRAFTPGWLERESIFMHMEFKYILSALKAGLYDEFFEDLRTALPPFMNPEVYGRSVLEHSSFIASSCNPDPTVHGQGFVARLSGTTAEYLTMWQMMMTGKTLFTVEEGQLMLTLQPILPEWLFDDNNQVEFTFLGKTKVTYHNPNRKDTFGENGAKIAKYVLHSDNSSVEVQGEKVEEQYAMQIREGNVNKIDVHLN
ncbi:cellobiose phosphorylase [Bacillus sp. SM2101]|uniref:cellobiose phosphorylase n=1 Tax=Bacillus sp. SM2101 TaxID=2805366 RepID=UPI0033256888